MKGETKDFLKGFIPGFLTGSSTSSHIHEPGHWIAYELLLEGRDDVSTWHTIEFDNFGLTGGNHPSNTISYPSFDYQFYDRVIASSGYAFNYLAALGLAALGRNIDKEEHKVAKSLVTGISIYNSISPSIFSFLDAMGLKHGDFAELANDGVPYEVTVPATLAASTALTYYNIKGWEDTVEKKTKRIYYNDGFWENRKNWKDKKEKVVDEFKDYFQGFEESLGDKAKAKLLRKEPYEVRAERTWKRLNKTAVSENYNERHLGKLADEMRVERDKAEKIVDAYLWHHEDSPELIESYLFE